MKPLHFASGICLGASVGAAVMYFMDPDCGRKRRRIANQKAMNLVSDIEDGVEQRARDVMSSAQSFVESSRAKLRRTVPDQLLSARLRTKAASLLPDLHKIQMAVKEGVVTLTGMVTELESSRLLKGLKEIVGVSRIENKLRISELKSHFNGKSKMQFKMPDNSTLMQAGLVGLGVVGMQLLKHAVEDSRRH